ncbi:hypothetical protein [Streptomyces sp. NPDC102437]|uniref:hypothetical protein n=1 Tax=Streptomyces sp. NPDC102437 TaxID=3366175 RepID=UPI00382C65C8
MGPADDDDPDRYTGHEFQMAPPLLPQTNTHRNAAIDGCIHVFTATALPTHFF